MMDIKASKDECIDRWVYQGNLIYVRWNRMKNPTKKVIDRGKRSKTLSEVKPIKNISTNLQSFLEISPMQEVVLPLH